MGVLQNVPHLFAPITANCAEFQRRWETAPLDSDGVSGCWEGEWVSAASGHRGRLRCVVNPLAPALWRMYFRGEYGRVFRACYSTDVSVAQKDRRWTLSGGSDLGVLAGGRYESTGYATPEEIVCSYRSAADHGEFRLKRYSAPGVISTRTMPGAGAR